MWEDEGRVGGSHEDHWKRAEEQHELTEQEAEYVTEANQKADDQFARDDSKPQSAADIRPPSVAR